MRYNVLASVALAAALISSAPASAADWTKNVGICAAAAEAEGLVTAGDYRAKFLSGQGAAIKTVAIELIPTEGDAITAECKIKRGEVMEIGVKA
ncbi:MAG: hypothetical protein R3C58_12040 [Parvularculaceae bacterium]